MIKKYYAVFGPAMRVLDAFILVFTWIVAYYLRKNFPLSIMTNGIPSFGNYIGLGVLIVLLWGSVFSVFDIYSSKRMTRRTIEAYKVLRAHGTSLLVFIVLTYLFSTYRLSRGVFLYFGLLSGILLVGVRLVLRNWMRRLRTQGFNLQKVLIAGLGPSAKKTFDQLNRHPELGLKFLGFIGDKHYGAAGEVFYGGLPVLGDFAEIRRVIEDNGIQKLVIALSHFEYSGMDLLLRSLKDEIVDIVLVPDLHEYLTLGCEVEDFDGLPMVSLNETPMAGFGAMMKRLGDIGLSIFAILLFSPVMIFLVLAIKLSSRGPVFFFQERMSLNGRRFFMYKFRSMKVDQKGDVELLTKANDPRVTKIGELMRRTSLDELPQFFNVLFGHMSIVGPRPERTWVVEELKDKIPSYMLKHKVKAGITGWAQVNGWRGDTSLEKRIECDLYYIRNWSLLFDLKILFLTIFKGFLNRNAY